jgi:hypothetical protein
LTSERETASASTSVPDLRTQIPVRTVWPRLAEGAARPHHDGVRRHDEAAGLDALRDLHRLLTGDELTAEVRTHPGGKWRIR